MKNISKVSVVVPIYKVEKYIAECARSLFEQTLDEIEFVFVNDCTPDNSMEILKNVLSQYPQRIKSVKIINHEHNQGSAITRKDGILAASGEYVIHCDSDDWVDPDMYRTMYKKAKEEDLDIVICPNLYHSDGGEYYIKRESACSDIQKHISRIITHTDTVSLCFRLVRNSILKNNVILYPTQSMMEDMVLSAQITFFAKKIGLIDQVFYHYRCNPDSQCRVRDNNAIINKVLQSKINLDILIKFLKENGAYPQFYTQVVKAKFWVRGFFYPSLKSGYINYWRWIRTYPRLNYQYLLTRGIKVSSKLLFLLTLCGMYALICKFKLLFSK